MIFDFGTFSKTIIQAYDESICNYDLEDVIAIFRYYFESYESYFKTPHPFINFHQVLKIMNLMDEVEDDELNRSHCIDPGEYVDMIDKYFCTVYKNCDYNINHFFSGKIRLIKLYETGGI